MDIYTKFLNHFDYDVRKTRDARWIDQKCTYDVISIISDCILEYVDSTSITEFTVSDIWHSNYARENVIEIFSKPDPELKAGNEYDKYFGQPIKLLSYSKILNTRKEKNRYYYSINNREILEKIALRPMNALEFLYKYISKVLEDSNLLSEFNKFFEIQTKEAYQNIKDNFFEFTIKNTNINGKDECGRIFTKIINPLAFKLKKLGTENGFISKHIITLNDLQYNRPNWRDKLSGKQKSWTRSEYEVIGKNNLNTKAMANYEVNKAKKVVRKFNDVMYNGKSEVYQASEYLSSIKATQAHHIFPQNEVPEISNYLENIIMLTPNQHFGMAHPDNKTQYINKDFQYICLISKAGKIRENLFGEEKNKIYDFDDYIYVLNTGLKTDIFKNIKELDFSEIIRKIDYFYSDFIENNKYKSLIKRNKKIKY